MKNIIFLSLVSIVTLSQLAHAHGPIPIPLEGIIKILDRQLGKEVDSIEIDASNLPPMSDDFDTLNSKDKCEYSAAYKRLLARGDAVITELTRRVSNPDKTLLETKQLYSILLRLNIPGTEKMIIKVTEELHNVNDETRRLDLKKLYYQTFKLLSDHDDTSTGVAYANSLLKDENIDPVIHVRALEFLAVQKTQSAVNWLDTYNKDNNDIGIKYASLYLKLRLEIDSSIQETIAFLKDLPKSQKNYKYETHLLLSSLTQFVEPTDFHEITETIKRNNGQFIADEKLNTYPLLSALYTGDTNLRSKAAIELLKHWSNNKNAVFESLKYMIKIQDAAPYVKLWKLHHPVLKRYLQHLGYKINVINNVATFVKSSDKIIITPPGSDTLAESIINSFKHNDKNMFMSTSLKSRYVFMQTRISPYKPTQKNKLNDLYDFFILNASKSWKETYDKAAVLNFDWKKVKIESSIKNILVGIDGAHIASIIISIDANNKKYTILLENCLLFDNQWYSPSQLKWI